MNRRGFLKRLSSGVVGLSLVDVEWIPTPSALTLNEGAALTDINTISAEYVRRLASALNQPWSPFAARFVPGAYAMGDHGLNHQLGIDFEVTPREMERGLNPNAWLEPAARRMADEIRHKELVAFGALPVALHELQDLEAAVATDDATGVAVRGI